MGFLSGLGGPLLTQAAQGLGAYNAGQKQENDQRVAHSLQLLMLKRQADKDALEQALGKAQIGHLNSQAEGQWGQAFAGEDEQGPGMFQQHKLTGEIRRAKVGGTTTPAGSPATNATTNPTSANPVDRPTDAMLQDVPGDINLNDPRFNMTPGAAQQDTTPPKQTAAGGSGVLRPLPKVTQPRAPTTVATTKGIAQWNPATGKWEQTGMQPHEAPAPPPTNVYLPSVDPVTHETTYSVVPNRGPVNPKATGLVKPATGGMGGGAPLAARASQFGLALSSAGDALPLHDKMASGKGVPFGLQSAAQTAHGEGYVSKIPFGQELGNRLLNSNPEYATYEAAMPALVLAGAHAVSGARINQEQIHQLTASMKLAPGDAKVSADQKKANLIDFLNAVRVSLPPDLAAQQESQVDPKTLSYLKSIGYGKAPTPRGMAMLQSVAPDAAPAADVGEGGRGAGGQAPARAIAPSAPPSGGLTAAQKARAAADPEYAAFLKSTGKIP